MQPSPSPLPVYSQHLAQPSTSHYSLAYQSPTKVQYPSLHGIASQYLPPAYSEKRFSKNTHRLYRLAPPSAALTPYYGTSIPDALSPLTCTGTVQTPACLLSLSRSDNLRTLVSPSLQKQHVSDRILSNYISSVHPTVQSLGSTCGASVSTGGTGQAMLGSTIHRTTPCGTTDGILPPKGKTSSPDYADMSRKLSSPTSPPIAKTTRGDLVTTYNMHNPTRPQKRATEVEPELEIAVQLSEDPTVHTLKTTAYQYTEDLLWLDAQREKSVIPLPAPCLQITTPFRVVNWEQALAQHPDRQFADYITNGIRYGFRIGYDYDTTHHRSAKCNMQSARENPGPVEEYVRAECAAGRLVPLPDQTSIHVSRFGVIPKSNQPGKWRLILDLSHPKGHSINDGIAPERCSLHYISVDTAVSKIFQLGRHTRLAKIDVEHAYRNVPVHPSDRHLLGMRWQNQLYVDTTLPFGLRSAPKIFTAVADALEWILTQRGVTSSDHYLDDFLTMGKATSSDCENNLRLILEVCEWLGVPLKSSKIEGPATTLTFLGIQLDTVTMDIRLPEEKLVHLMSMLAGWRTKKRCTKRELLSLIGKLNHAAKVVVAGRLFLRRMIGVAYSVRELHHWVHLSEGFRSDLEWWFAFLSRWNGRSMMEVHNPCWSPQVTFSSDASGSWGCGAVWRKEWIQCQWNSTWADKGIAVKELLPIVLAVALWGRQWTHCQVLVQCDNMAVVSVINTLKCKESTLLHLMRCLHFVTAQCDIKLRAEHIQGVLNVAADAVSRNNLQVFRDVVRDASPHPVPVPPQLWQLLVTHMPDWLSPTWRSLLTDFWSRA